MPKTTLGQVVDFVFFVFNEEAVLAFEISLDSLVSISVPLCLSDLAPQLLDRKLAREFEARFRPALLSFRLIDKVEG